MTPRRAHAHAQSYGWLVHGYARENNLKKAIDLVREMKARDAARGGGGGGGVT